MDVAITIFTRQWRFQDLTLEGVGRGLGVRVRPLDPLVLGYYELY